MVMIDFEAFPRIANDEEVREEWGAFLVSCFDYEVGFSRWTTWIGCHFGDGLKRMMVTSFPGQMSALL
jgi:hypothetical protein